MSEFLSQAGVRHTHIPAASIGPYGNGHMGMIENEQSGDHSPLRTMAAAKTSTASPGRRGTWPIVLKGLDREIAVTEYEALRLPRMCGASIEQYVATATNTVIV